MVQGMFFSTTAALKIHSLFVVISMAAIIALLYIVPTLPMHTL